MYIQIFLEKNALLHNKSKKRRLASGQPSLYIIICVSFSGLEELIALVLHIGFKIKRVDDGV